MKINMGSADRIVRVLIALVIGVLFFTHVISGILGIILLVVAGIFFLTAVFGFCPCYAMLGISSCPRRISE